MERAFSFDFGLLRDGRHDHLGLYRRVGRRL
jgi:hypothetical protein